MAGCGEQQTLSDDWKAPAHLYAADAGLKVIDVDPLPMIWYTTISSGLPFVKKHPDIVERLSDLHDRWVRKITESRGNPVPE